MSRIIKAGSARFSRVLEPGEDAGAREDTPNEPLHEDGEQTAAPDPDVQAAYDELMTAAQDEVAAMLREARDEAQIIIRDADRQADEIRGQGYEEGYAQGLREVREETEEILRRAERDAADLIEQAKAEHDGILSETEPKLLKLALEVAEKILHRELDGDDSAYMSILSHALGAVKAESKVALRVNPSDYVRYFNSRENAKIRTPNGNVTAQVMIDSSVGSGGCLIETDSGSIDSSPSAQIAQIANSLGIGYGANGGEKSPQ